MHEGDEDAGCVIRITDEMGIVIDEVAGETPETFTLYEFRHLVRKYRERNKDFLVARVRTRDGTGHQYNSYYVAGEFNRELFKYDNYQALLHRMNIKNPLNNLFINPPVEYYRITVTEVDEASDRGRLDRRDEISAQSIDGEPDGGIKPDQNANKQIVYEARYFADEDDFMNNSDVREYFKENMYSCSDEFLYDVDYTVSDEYSQTDLTAIIWQIILTCMMAILAIVFCVITAEYELAMLISFIFAMLLFPLILELRYHPPE